MILPRIKEDTVAENAHRFWLERLALRDFRNYAVASVEASPGVNLVSGANAQGKTSLLEAVALISTGRLIRGSRDAQAIRHGYETAKAEGHVGGIGTSIAVELRRGQRKLVELNGMSLPRASDVLGRLPSVSFSAADLCIVTGEPGDRRQFMDTELAQLFPAYLKNLTVYKRAVDQRNALLRQAQAGPVPGEVFEPWEHSIATSGTLLRAARADWIKELSQDAEASHAQLGAGEALSLEYEVRDEGVEIETAMRLLSSGRSLDVARGSTTTGPHRDELAIRISGTEARYFGSQGQQRTAVIAMKLAVLRHAQRLLGYQPVLLLDDVFSDLDHERRARLMDLTLDGGGQVFLTCTEPEQVGVDLVQRSRVFRVESGRVSEA